MSRSLQILLLFSLLLTTVPATDAQEQPVRTESPYTITVIPYYSPEKLWTKFTPLIEYLTKKTGHAWELKLYHNHQAVLDAVCSGKVSFALLGPVPLARAIDQCGAGIAAVAVGKDGKPYYRSMLLTGDPDVRDIEGLRGKPFGLFKGSTAAHIYPLKMLHEAGIRDDGIKPVFFESQDRIMNGLLQRTVAGAGVKESLYEKFRDQQLRVLKVSDRIPGFAFTVTPHLPASIRKEFVEALLPLHPLANQRDRERTQDWDDEIKYGLIRPPADFRDAVRRVGTVYQEMVHEDR